MKLLVLAHTPPPLHGQSVMVQAMLAGLATRPGFSLHHVNFRLSRDAADIGRWRIGKIANAARLAIAAVVARFRHGCDTLYYVPSPPGKRGALYRDWLVIAICRPFFRRLVLHWHAAGLGAWLESKHGACERLITRMLLGRADLAIVVSDSLRLDAEYLCARRIAIVPNGIPDPGPPASRPPRNAPFQALFLGLCSEEKGVFAAANAIIAANQRVAASPASPQFTLVAAGPFPDDASAARFAQLAVVHPSIRHVGFADATEKTRLFAESQCLLFPTRYLAEGLPLVVLEALAHDRPILATRWRGLPDAVTPDCGHLVEVDATDELAAALLRLRESPPAAGACRTRFLEHYRLERHLARLAEALSELDRVTPTTSAEKRA